MSNISFKYGICGGKGGEELLFMVPQSSLPLWQPVTICALEQSTSALALMRASIHLRYHLEPWQKQA